MALTFTCVAPDGSVNQIPLNTLQVSGNIVSQFPNLRAKRINVTFYQCQQAIQEGRAAGITPFNIQGSTLMKNGSFPMV